MFLHLYISCHLGAWQPGCYLNGLPTCWQRSHIFSVVSFPQIELVMPYVARMTANSSGSACPTPRPPRQTRRGAIFTSPRFLCNSVSSSWCLILSWAISCSWLSFHAPSCPGLNAPTRQMKRTCKREKKKSDPRALQSGTGTITLEFQTCTWQYSQESSSVLQANRVISHYKPKVESRRYETQGKTNQPQSIPSAASGIKDGFRNKVQVNGEETTRSTHPTSIWVPALC